MGDFFLQEVLLKVPPSPRHPEAGPTPYNHFSFQSGSVLFDFLTQLSLEHDWLHSGQPQTEPYDTIRKNISNRIHGPCRLQGWSPTGPDAPASDEERSKLADCRSAILSRARKEHITLEETSAHGTANARKALRIKEFQGHSAQATSPLSRPAVENPCLAIMSCDFQFFLEQGLDKCFTDYNPQGSKCPVVCRIVLGPTVDLDEPSSIDPGQTKVEAISENLARAVKDMSQGPSAQPSVAVISSSTLKNFGFKISFRRSWERTIDDAHAAVFDSKLEVLLSPFTFVVVTFFNEGVLIVNRRERSGENIFIFHPTSLEAELSLAVDGATKGTETLVTQAIATAFLRGRELNLEAVAKASLKGLKASRFLLVRGYSRVSLGDWNYIADTLNYDSFLNQDLPRDHSDNIKADGKPKDELKDNVLKALRNRIDQPDVVHYLWNRSRKNAFFELQKQLVGTDVPDNKQLATWPFGDLIEILSKGYVTYGSFPPTGVDDEAARGAIEKSTRDTATAFYESGWLQMVVIAGLANEKDEKAIEKQSSAAVCIEVKSSTDSFGREVATRGDEVDV